MLTWFLLILMDNARALPDKVKKQGLKIWRMLLARVILNGYQPKLFGTTRNQMLSGISERI